MSRDRIAIVLLIVAAFAFGRATADLFPSKPVPRLIAHRCDGSGGDLWAMDESDFPTPCRDIEEY